MILPTEFQSRQSGGWKESRVTVTITRHIFFCPPTQALVHVRCLGCYQGFDVAYGFWNSTGMNLPDAEVLQAIDGYSDEPPFHLRATDGFACAGLSSGVEVELVLQVWQRHALEWVRCAHLEGDMPCL